MKEIQLLLWPEHTDECNIYTSPIELCDCGMPSHEEL